MLHVHRSERADALVGPLAGVLAEPPSDPFAVDVVAVPTRGVERWLAQRLSHHLGSGPDGEAGVCANVTFGSPTRLVDDVLASLAEDDPVDGHEDHQHQDPWDPEHQDPWDPEHLVWSVLEVVDGCAHEPWCSVLGRHLGLAGDEARRGRRLAVARHLTRLFTSYGSQRPDMLTGWAAGSDDDGAGGGVPEDLAWQPELWRRVRAAVAVASPAERLAGALATVDDEPGRLDLPDRVSVFGPTRLPEVQLRVLTALAVHRDVHLWLPHPSPALWQRVDGSPATSRRRGAVPRAAAHPLLASMARDATELQRRLSASETSAGHHHRAPDPPRTLLGALQQRLRDDDPVAPSQDVDPLDRTLQVHACHGRARQVEVLREVLVGLLADDPTLEPRDVLVMCPDIEAVAPLVAATFGLTPDGAPAHSVHPGQELRVRLADRSLRQTNPVLSLLARLLELADGRVTASDVLDLAATPPVRRRFRLEDDDLDRIRDWTVAAGVRWGEDAARRDRFGLGTVRQGTWDAGLDRVLLGAAMAEEDHRFVGAALPLDDVDSTDIDLAGRLAELVDRLCEVLARLDGTQPLAEWLEHLDHALDLLADVAPQDGWQLVQARQVLADVRTSGGRHEDAPLRLADARALLAGRLQGRPTRAGFRTGALTVCSLEPMRAVPHRVVCLLGMDDGAFPRGSGTDGDDVLLRDPCLGERDRRSEDRQLFLDAVAAAEDHLVVLFTGADERTGAERPPAVPVGELLDALDQAVSVPGGTAARDHVVVRHPLQPVDERNFVADRLGRTGPFSFDAVAHRAAVAGRRERIPPPPFLASPLPRPGWQPDVDLDALVGALEHPVKAFLRTRLGVALPRDEEDVEDRLPLDLDGLESWEIGDRLLDACLAGAPRDQALAAEWRRGQVPPKELGRAELRRVEELVVPVADAARPHAVGPPAAVDVSVDLPDGRVLTGTVPGVHGTVVVRAVYSRLAPKHRLRAWVQLLALTAARPDATWSAVTVGRPQGKRPGVAVSTLAAPGDAYALQRLVELVGLLDRALREPLPMPVAVAAAYARSRHGGDPEVQALGDARRTWAKGFERSDDHHVLCWGEATELDEIAGDPTSTEQAWWPEDRSRLGVLARRVWDPLLTHERMGSA